MAIVRKSDCNCDCDQSFDYFILGQPLLVDAQTDE